MYQIRTDLAVEAHRLWQEGESCAAQLTGVSAEETELEGFSVEKISILTEEGAERLGKPVGEYVTLYLTGLLRRERDGFSRAVRALAAALGRLLPEGEGAVLVAGLGNRAITPDAIGPLAVDAVLATRHLRKQLPEQFGNFRPVSAVAAGVLGTTGMESGELVQALAGRVKPELVIAVDALAGRSMERLCATVQLTDTGIVPGSGVGNGRAGLSMETLGVPVIAIGVPTVVEAGTLAIDLLRQAGQEPDEELLGGAEASLIVTPKDIDRTVAELGRLIGFAINLALHPWLSMGDMEMMV